MTLEHEQRRHGDGQQHEQRGEHIAHAAAAVGGGARQPQHPDRSAAAVTKGRIAEGSVRRQMRRDREALTGRIRGRSQQIRGQPRGVKGPQRFCQQRTMHRLRELRGRGNGQGFRHGQPTENSSRRAARDNGPGNNPAAVGKVRRSGGRVVRRPGRGTQIPQQFSIRLTIHPASLGELCAEPHGLRCRDDQQGIKSGVVQGEQRRVVRRRGRVVRQKVRDRIGLRKPAGAIRQL